MLDFDERASEREALMYTDDGREMLGHFYLFSLEDSTRNMTARFAFRADWVAFLIIYTRCGISEIQK